MKSRERRLHVGVAVDFTFVPRRLEHPGHHASARLDESTPENREEFGIIFGRRDQAANRGTVRREIVEEVDQILPQHRIERAVRLDVHARGAFQKRIEDEFGLARPAPIQGLFGHARGIGDFLDADSSRSSAATRPGAAPAGRVVARMATLTSQRVVAI
ncbi:hypothetical protein SB764_37230 [Paraburkholderia sp. SIMBA_027]